MHQIGLFSTYTSGECYGIINELMTMVRLLPSESIDNKYLHSMEERQFAIINVFHIRDIRHIAKTIAENRQLVMHDFHTHDINISYLKMLMLGNGMQFQLRYTRIRVIGEAIGEVVFHRPHRISIGIDVKIPKFITERS